jgi:hypothetical protein
MGEAKRKREAATDAYAFGQAVPRPSICPACGGKRIAFSTINDCEYGVCPDCEAVWEAFPPLYVEDVVCAEPCDNCAFRPGSPEQADPEKWKALIASLKPDQSYGHFTGQFFCHKNVPIDIKRGRGNFLFPRRKLVLDGIAEPVDDFDVTKMRRCVGWLRMVWAQNAKGGTKA